MSEKNKTFSVTTNQILPDIEVRIFENQEFLVFPAIIVKSKVLNGMFLPQTEITKFGGQIWEGVIVTLDHPEDNDGFPVSANLREISRKYQIGRLYNIEIIDNSKIKADIYINSSRLQGMSNGGEIYDQIKNGVQMEVSTGYWMDMRFESGEFQGEKYFGIQQNIVPDHLAILSENIGACSIDDGCGTMKKNSKRENEDMNEEMNQAPIVNDVDETEIAGEAEETDVQPGATENQPKNNQDPTENSTPCGENSHSAPSRFVEGLERIVNKLGGIEKFGETLLRFNEQQKSEKETLVSQVSENTGLEKEDLQNLRLEALKRLAENSKPKNYSGQAVGVVQHVNNEDVQAPPAVMFAKDGE